MPCLAPASPLRAALWLLPLTALLLCLSAKAEEGITESEVRLGMVNAQSGPAAGLGSGMLAGVQAYLQRINAAGGVHGRQIKLVVRDDGYEPVRSAEQTRELLAQENIFALIGYVGTPTSRAVMPIALQAQVPYLFPFTGAQVLRSPVHRWVFNVRASYFDETEEMVERMSQDLKITQVALLMQDDSFGEAVKSGLVGALAKRGLQLRGEARFARNSLQLAGAVAALKAQDPPAIFFVGTYRQLAEAIREARRQGMRARFFTVSFVGTDSLIAEAGQVADGVHITQVVPSPQDPALAVVRDYRADMAGKPLGYTSLEGYLGARVFVEALREAGPRPTRAALVGALEFLRRDLGGFHVEFSPDDHQGSDAVFLTRIQNGRAEPVMRMR